MPGSVTVSRTVCGAVVPGGPLAVVAGEQGGRENAGEQGAGQEQQHECQRHAAPAVRPGGGDGEGRDLCRPGGAVERIAQRLDERDGRAKAVLRLLGESPREDVVELARQARVRVGRRRDRRAHVGDRLGGRGLALERPLARQELEGDDAEGVEVACGRGALAAGLLRRQVARRADDRARFGEGAEVGRARHAEVGDLDALVAVEQQVPGLDVAMDDPVRVCRVERGRCLAEPVERASHGLRTFALETVCQRAAREVLHHDVRPAVVLADVEDRDRARRVREPGDGERLAGEAPADRVVVCEPVRQQLDGDDPREVGVLRPVDLAHAAPRDQLRVPVAVGKLALVHHDGLPRSAPRKTRGVPGFELKGSVKNAWMQGLFS